MGHGPTSPLLLAWVLIISRFNTSIINRINQHIPRYKPKGLSISSKIFKILSFSLPRWFLRSFRRIWAPDTIMRLIPPYAARKDSGQTTAVVGTVKTITAGFTCQYYRPIPIRRTLILQSCSSLRKAISHRFIGPHHNRPSTLLPCSNNSNNSNNLNSNITITGSLLKLPSRYPSSPMRA